MPKPRGRSVPARKRSAPTRKRSAPTRKRSAPTRKRSAVAPPASARQKLLSRARARSAVHAALRRGERVVFSNGCFDLLHVGHVRCLEAARRLGDRLIIGVNSDASVRRLKGSGRPVVPARRRAEVLAALACVDWVVIFDETTPLALIRALRPNVLAKGGDWTLDTIVGKHDVESWGGRVVSLAELRGEHTTALLSRIRQR